MSDLRIAFSESMIEYDSIDSCCGIVGQQNLSLLWAVQHGKRGPKLMEGALATKYTSQDVQSNLYI